MSMLSSILSSPTGPNNNVYAGFPPPVYTSPYHLFNIDDESTSSKVPTEPKMAFPQGDHDFYSQFDFVPESSQNEEANHLINLQDQLFASSPLQQLPEGLIELPQEEAPSPFLPFGSQASSPHNRRMIFPYNYKKQKGSGSKSTSSSSSSQGTMRDEPLLLYRFFEFYCTNCEQCWLSPLFRAKNGCYCRICHHFILPRGIRHSFTPYLGKETCYGKYSCHLCNRGWSSYKSMSNCPDQCFQCGTMVYPYYQIAHSVLFQKIHKNDDELNAKSAFLKSFLLTKSPGSVDEENDSPGSESRRTGRQQQRSRRNSRRQSAHPRKITSISALRPLSGVSSVKQTVTSKKRLHCLNNIPFVTHTAQLQQVRKQFHLKSCFSEPIILNNSKDLEVAAEICKFKKTEEQQPQQQQLQQ